MDAASLPVLNQNIIMTTAIATVYFLGCISISISWGTI